MYDPKVHHRRSIRLQEFDYSQAGMYFITICSANHKNVFGDIINDEMILNEWGRAAAEEWTRTAEIRPTVDLDEFVIMPNHLHGIVILLEKECKNEPLHQSPVYEKYGNPTSNSIPTIIRGYKAAVTRRIDILRGNTDGAVWQPGYYENIIRNYSAYEKIKEYTGNNPANWPKDSLWVK
jgi:putative transposase